MICIVMYVVLGALWVLVKKGKIRKPPKGVFLILFLSVTLSLVMFISQSFGSDTLQIQRNTYGDGSRLEEFQVEIEGTEGAENVQLEVAEQEYTSDEIQAIFTEVMEELDKIILDDNDSFNRVEKNLNLVSSLPDYPVEIEWELDSYNVMNVEGEIRQENVVESGTLVEIRGIITYLDEQVIYVRNAMVYPVTLKGMDLILHNIQEALQKREESTRQDASFSLPEEVDGQELSWSKKENNNGYYILIMGIVFAVFLVYRERENEKNAIAKRHAQLIREYPGMISKLTMLLSTGMTVKKAWEKIVHNYESQKEQMGSQIVYEEMATALHEMQGGIPEGEAYERFGRRCELTVYLKFSAMLSQNLRKGSRGISDLLRVEAIQSFENRKSLAKREGEEAGTKLLMPMMGMLAVVLIMVMVPAFMTMQL